MYHDSLMPVQGSGVSGMGLGPRVARLVAMGGATVVLAGAIFRHTGTPTVTPAGTLPITEPCSCSEAAVPSLGMVVELCREGEASDAVEMADGLLAAPNTPNAEAQLRRARAGALRLLGRAAEARLEYAREAELEASSGTLDERLASLGDSRDLNGTRRLALEVANMNPGNATAQNNAAWALLIYGTHNAAEALRLVKPVAVGCKDPCVLDTYAWALYQSGNSREAVRQETLALDYVNGSPVNGDYIRDCLAGFRGDRANAERDLREVFQMNVLDIDSDAWCAADRFAERT